MANNNNNNNVIKQIQLMYEQELYSNVIRVCDLTLTTIEQKNDLNNLLLKFQLLLYYADSLYHTQQYLQSENLYRQSMHLRKSLIKNKNSSAANNNNKLDLNELISDIEIKYRIYLCCIALKQNTAALDILQGIPARTRTAKIYMALGNLYRDSGMDRSAITCYKEVLRECPLALDSVENLLKLGVKGVEVNSLMLDAVNDINWLKLWLKAQAQLYSRDFNGAYQTYKAMDVNGLLKDNIYVIVNMAYCCHYICDYEKAIILLQYAIHLDQNVIFGRDLLANLLATYDNNNKEYFDYLESLTLPINNLDMSLWTCEQWLVIGYYTFATKKYERALYLGQQALLKNKKNIEGLLLKAKTLIELTKYQEAAEHCTRAVDICPFRYDVHECLVDCYVKMNRLREADSMALNACKQLNYSAQSLTLHASVLLKDPLTSSKTVRKILEKAVAQDKNFSTHAICMLGEFLVQEQQYESASFFLLKYIDHHPTSRLHQLLGDCFIHLQKDDAAFNHYNISLKLDPTNQRASEGLNNIGRNLSLSKQETYYTCIVGEDSRVQQSTEHEVDVESDTDQWPNSNSFE